MRHIPNILSALRIIMVGIFACLFLEGRPIAALSVFVLAFLTDILDGYLARRNNWISNIGKLLDPFADKLLTVVALVCICIGKRQAAFIWLCALTAAKELLMVFGGMFLLRRRVVVYADWFGKIATGVFGAGIILAMLSFRYPQMSPWDLYVLALATALSYLALIHYALRSFFPRLFHKDAPEDAPGGGREAPEQ